MTDERSFPELVSFLNGKYGQRNALYIPGVSDRIHFLYEGVHLLEDCVVESKHKEYGPRLASVFMRSCAVADILCLSGLYPQAMAAKYPPSHCVYCGYEPCQCPREGRKHARLVATPSLEECTWSLTEWCRGLDRKYGEVNRDRGIHFAIHRLYSEVSEVTMIYMAYVHSPLPPHVIRWMYATELADVTAWIIGVANILDVSLEQAVAERYGGQCRKCGEYPCQCGPPHMGARRDLWDKYRAQNEGE